MSLQPCLPLPPSCSSSRSRRCRRGGRKRPLDQGSHDRDDDECRHSDDERVPPAGPPPHRISDLAGMSALEFLGRVHEESRRLGDVFVAEGAEGAAALAFACASGPADANDANASTCASRRGAGDRPGEEAEEEEEEEEEGEISDKDTRTHATCKEKGKTKREDCNDDDPKSQMERSRPLSFHTAAAADTTSTRPCSTDDATNGKRSGSNVGITGSLAYLLSGRTDLPRPPSAAHLPTSTSVHAGSPTPATASSSVWADVTIDDFSKLRLYLDACVQGNVGGKQSGTRMAVPPMRARDGWHMFCLGKEEARGYCQDDDDDDGGGDTDKPLEQLEPWEANIPATGHPPSTALLCQMDQVMVRRVLAHHIAYLCDGGSSSPEVNRRRRYMYHRTHSAHAYAMTTNRARWVYGLLARLAKPLHRDDAAAVRQLLRECCVRRAGLDAKNDARAGREVSLLNALIAIAGIYFEQGTADALFPRL